MPIWCSEAMAEASRRQVEREAAASMSSAVDVLPPASVASMESPPSAAAPAPAPAPVPAPVECGTNSVPAVPVPGPVMPPNMMPPHMLPGT